MRPLAAGAALSPDKADTRDAPRKRGDAPFRVVGDLPEQRARKATETRGGRRPCNVCWGYGTGGSASSSTSRRAVAVGCSRLPRAEAPPKVSAQSYAVAATCAARKSVCESECAGPPVRVVDSGSPSAMTVPSDSLRSAGGIVASSEKVRLHDVPGWCHRMRASPAAVLLPLGGRLARLGEPTVPPEVCAKYCRGHRRFVSALWCRVSQAQCARLPFSLHRALATR
jgi:hypothetical protein